MKNIHNFISFLFQLLLLISGYVACCYYYLEVRNLKELINPGLLILISSWTITAWLTHKYKPQYYQKKWIYVIAPFIKAAFFQLFFILILSSIFLESYLGKGLLLKSSILYLSVELLIYSLIILIYGKKNSTVQERHSDVKKYLQKDLEPDLHIKPNIDFSSISSGISLFTEKIYHELHTAAPAEITNSSDVLIIKSIKDLNREPKQYPVCILDIRINDLKDINKSFVSIYQSIVPGGYLFALYKDLDDFESESLSSTSRLIKFFKTLFYYLYYRAFPKIPYLNVFYGLISGGRNKVISRAETLGRLYYCGFEVEKQIKNEGVSYILARKLKTPSENPAPSFYPIITLNRIGLYGTVIKIHKIRSMYPYSEFLQQKVFEESSITSTGKFGNDYRITKFGKIFRKYWIDEIPQLIDWFRGKIKLVGIRAMSQHYFGLYSKDYQDLYIQVKPGIFSPIFDEKISGFDDIQRIEKEYLVKYLQSPVKTDIEYFILTIKQIINGVRSK
jgi:lipopolysaccharide/colanic/teichoic acid biosynthesis glycosyltransferase